MAYSTSVILASISNTLIMSFLKRGKLFQIASYKTYCHLSCLPSEPVFSTGALSYSSGS